MNKKFIALLIFVVAIASVSAVSAFDLSDISNAILGNGTNDNVNISGIEFNVPKGFEEVTNQSIENEPDDNPYVDYNLTEKTYVNNEGKVIILSVSSSSNITITDLEGVYSGENKTTINGVEGYLSDDPNFTEFGFIKDGKFAIISANDKELINDIVVA